VTVYRIDLAYEGSGFRGYARQPEVRTVQGELEAALQLVVPGAETVVAGRTDAGVHADGQVVSFAADQALDTGRLLRSLNKMLNPEIAVKALSVAPEGFNARFSAISRTYRYRIDNGAVLDPQWRWRAWHVGFALDLDAMGSASSHLVGRHDFASFCRAVEGRSSDRDVLATHWRRFDGRIVEFEVTASSFCQQMVRSLVLLCVDVGRGKIDPAAVPDILTARHRGAVRGAAPPHGLTLWHVAYGDVASRGSRVAGPG
jgi:tRNA pseudouridine38-40 synthase